MSPKLEKVHVEVRALLKQQGMRSTEQRVAVLTTLHEQQVPMTHEEVMGILSLTKYDKASIWRVLSDLAEVGILRRMDLGDRIWRYELNDACRTLTYDHPHFLCEECSEVTCLPSLEVRMKGGGLPRTRFCVPSLYGAPHRVRMSDDTYYAVQIPPPASPTTAKASR